MNVQFNVNARAMLGFTVVIVSFFLMMFVFRLTGSWRYVALSLAGCLALSFLARTLVAKRFPNEFND